MEMLRRRIWIMRIFMLFIIITPFVSMAVVRTPVCVSSTVLSVYPSEMIDATKIPGDTFTINITIANVEDLWEADGYFANKVHDIAVTNVTASSTEVWVGEPVFINVTVENQGVFLENNINVTVMYGDTEIESQIVTNLADGASTTLTFTWYTTDVIPGDYMISAEAKLPSGTDEPDIEDNKFDDGIVTVTPPAVVAVDPPTIVDETLTPGSTFSINITVAQVEDLWGFEFVLNYDTTVLTATGYSSYDPFTYEWPSKINDTAGKVALAFSMPMGTKEGFSTVDPVPIARIDFTVDSIGNSTLYFERPLRLSTPKPSWIAYDAFDGFFANVAVPLHDIAITSVTASPTEVFLYDSVYIDVSIINKGNINETFDVNVFYGETLIETREGVFLDAGASTTLTFIWVTTEEGTYTIKAGMPPVPGEEDLTDNILEDGIVTVTAAPPILVATVDIKPETLNLRSNGSWITCYVQLPEGFNAEDIDVSTIRLEDVVPAEWAVTENSVLIAKFDRAAVTNYIRDVLGTTDGEVTLTVTGKLVGGTPFEGSDTIIVISKGRGARGHYLL